MITQNSNEKYASKKNSQSSAQKEKETFWQMLLINLKERKLASAIYPALG